MGIINSVIVAAFIVYYFASCPDTFGQVLLFKENETLFSIFVWLYILWGVINLFF